MRKLREFIKSTLVGGLLVLLPVAIFAFVLVWVFNVVHKAISPLTKLVTPESDFQVILADVLVVLVLICACFLVGAVVRTRLGTWLYLLIETKLLRRTPGYSLIKETVSQFLGKKKSPFSSVALVRLFGNDTMASAFITDTHEDGSHTVFVPTGPNPTSGNIYHLRPENVFPVDVPVEDAMRSIISCGAGSSMLLAKLKEAHPEWGQTRS
jgi:uncharacterized membrane protein